MNNDILLISTKNLDLLCCVGGEGELVWSHGPAPGGGGNGVWTPQVRDIVYITKVRHTQNNSKVRYTVNIIKVKDTQNFSKVRDTGTQNTSKIRDTLT